jgi:hypothetical protein
MKALLIQSLNSIWLVIIFIGVPAVSSLRLGSLQISSRPVWHMLVLSGIAIALALNTGACWRGVHSKKEKRICLRWISGYALLGVTFLAYSEKWIGFKWLKSLLLHAQGFL